jgi:hypothetical protein
VYLFCEERRSPSYTALRTRAEEINNVREKQRSRRSRAQNASFNCLEEREGTISGLREEEGKRSQSALRGSKTCLTLHAVEERNSGIYGPSKGGD